MDLQNDAIYKQVYGYVHYKVCKLSDLNDSMTTKTLAELRSGLGHSPDEATTCWGVLFQNAPNALIGTYGEPTKAEWAVFVAMTLFGLHSQGKGRGHAYQQDIRLGKALAMLAVYGCNNGSQKEIQQERSRNCLNQLISAKSIKSLASRLRRVCNLLYQSGIPLDYPALASDLYLFQLGGTARQSVVMSWGRDFYRSINEKNNKK